MWKTLAEIKKLIDKMVVEIAAILFFVGAGYLSGNYAVSYVLVAIYIFSMIGEMVVENEEDKSA